jgi:hypothetical protein
MTRSQQNKNAKILHVAQRGSQSLSLSLSLFPIFHFLSVFMLSLYQQLLLKASRSEDPGLSSECANYRKHETARVLGLSVTIESCVVQSHLTDYNTPCPPFSPTGNGL